MLEKILLGICLALPPAIFWGYFFYKKDKAEPEPLRLMMKSFFYGVGAAVLVMLFQHFLQNHSEWNVGLWLGRILRNEYWVFLVFFTLIGFVEEYVKHVSVTKLVENNKIKFNQIIDGIEYSIAAALGFAFIENVYYFLLVMEENIWGWSFLVVVVFRGMGTMLAHTLFSGIFGYYYGLSKMLPKIVTHQKHPAHHFYKHVRHVWKLHILRSHVRKDRQSKKGHDAGQLVAEGLLLAGLLHMGFNLFNSVEVMGISMAFLNVPLLMGTLWFLLKAFRKRRNLLIR